MALTQAPNNLPHFNRKDWDENSEMGGSLFIGEMGQMAVGVDTSDFGTVKSFCPVINVVDFYHS